MSSGGIPIMTGITVTRARVKRPGSMPRVENLGCFDGSEEDCPECDPPPEQPVPVVRDLLLACLEEGSTPLPSVLFFTIPQVAPGQAAECGLKMAGRSFPVFWVPDSKFEFEGTYQGSLSHDGCVFSAKIQPCSARAVGDELVYFRLSGSYSFAEFVSDNIGCSDNSEGCGAFWVCSVPGYSLNPFYMEFQTTCDLWVSNYVLTE